MHISEWSSRMNCWVESESLSRLTKLLFIPEVPPNPPVIHGIRSRYKVNEIIRGNCTSKLSRPAVNLTWTINDIIVSINIVTSIIPWRNFCSLCVELENFRADVSRVKLAENLCIHHSCYNYNITLGWKFSCRLMLCCASALVGGKFRLCITTSYVELTIW